MQSHGVTARNNDLNSLKEVVCIGGVMVNVQKLARAYYYITLHILIYYTDIGEANTGHVPQMLTWPFPKSWVDAPNHPSLELVD